MGIYLTFILVKFYFRKYFHIKKNIISFVELKKCLFQVKII